MKSVFDIEDLGFTYRKGVRAVDGVSFTVQKGEIFGLLGPSGAGKSTTQKILTRLLHRFEGTVRFEGRDLRSYGNEFYERIGVGFELPVHFSKLTGKENMEFFARLYSKTADIDSLLQRVGLFEDRDRLVGEYSKGMKMRLNFVRAMLNDPEVLFLDEATNGLDPKNARIIKDLIREFQSSGGTVLLSTHLMGDVEELCDRVGFITDGRIREIASPRDLKLRHGRRELVVEYREGKTQHTERFNLDTIGEDERFFELVRNKDIETMHSGETTLEEIFIKVTGETVDA